MFVRLYLRFLQILLRGDVMNKKKGTFIDPKISTDPMGSYTGLPDDPNDRPIQDADDL